MKFVKKPTVDFSEFVDAIYRITFAEREFDYKDAFVGRLAQRFVYVVYRQGAVFYETVHPLSYHAESLLDYLLKGAADSHHLAHRFHRRANLAAHTMEFTQIPTRDFAHNIVESRLKECRCYFGNGVFKLKQPISETEFGCDKRKRIACRL